MTESYTFLTAYFHDVPAEQLIELTYIHHDKTRPNHIVTRFLQVGDKQGLRDHLAVAAEYNADGYGIYFGVCPRATLPDPGRRGSESHVDTIVGFWTELDSVKEGHEITADLNKLREGTLPPSFCVLSGGGVQGYWLLPEPIKLTDDNRALIKSALRGLGRAVGGDLNVAEYARVLRVPGFVNTKPERQGARTSLVLPEQKQRYQLGALLAYAPPPEPVRVPRPFTHESHDDRVELAQTALNAISLSRCDEYELWTYVGMSLREFGATGLSLWEAWSTRSSKYKSGECERKWNSFDEHGYNLGSLCKWANEDTGGTSWRPFKIDLSPALPTAVSDRIGSPLDWSHGLNTGERGASYRFADRATATLFEIAAKAPTSFDIAYLVCMGEQHGLSESAIRKAVDRLPVVFLYSRDDLNTIPERESGIGIALDCNCVAELQKRKIGRPAQLYRFADRATFRSELVKLAIPQIIKEVFPKKNNQLQLAPPIHAAFLEELGLDEDEARVRAAELEARYGAELKAQPGWREAMQEVRKRVRDLKAQLLSADYAPLPDDATLDNRPNMLAAAMRALMQFLGGAFQMGRAKLCALVGCRDKELAGVCRNAGIAIDKNAYALRPVVNLPDLLGIPHKFDPKMGGFPVDVQSTLDKRPMHLDSPNLERWAIKQIIGQAKLTVRYRLANRYRLAEPETITETTPKTLSQASVLPEQKSLFEIASPRDTFLPYWRALVVFQFAARLLNALVIAYEVAKEAVWYARQSAEKVVKYGEALVNKLVDLATPWQRRGDTLLDRSTGEVMTASLQLSLDLLLARQEHNLASTKDSEAPVGMKLPEESLELPSDSGSMGDTEPCKEILSKSVPSANGDSSSTSQSPPESPVPANTSSTWPYAWSGPTQTTAPPLSPPMPSTAPNTNRLLLEGT